MTENQCAEQPKVATESMFLASQNKELRAEVRRISTYNDVLKEGIEAALELANPYQTQPQVKALKALLSHTLSAALERSRD